MAAAVLLFVLHQDPRSPVGRRFDAILNDRLPGAWRMTCPPLQDTGVKGESQYTAEVVLAASLLRDGERPGDTGVLRRRLTDYSKRLAGVLGVPTRRLELRIVGH